MLLEATHAFGTVVVVRVVAGIEVGIGIGIGKAWVEAKGAVR